MILERDLNIILSVNASWEKLKDKNVMITGATGRLGLYIAHALFLANDRFGLNITVILAARSHKKLEMEYGQFLKRSDVQVLLQDILQPVCISVPVDYIFHTAGLASPEDFTNRSIETLWGHVQGTKNILDFAVETHAQRILYVSTVEIYGVWKGEQHIREIDMGPLSCTNPRACYPEAKRLCETMLTCYKKEKNVDFVSVRMSHTLGPGISLEDGRAFAEFLRCVLHDEDIILQSDGSAIRTYTYTADAVAAMFLALLNGDQCFYNIASEENQISVRELAELIASLSKSGMTKIRFSQEEKSRLAYLPFKLGVLDCTQIRALGWRPQVKLKEMFQWTLDSLT